MSRSHSECLQVISVFTGIGFPDVVSCFPWSRYQEVTGPGTGYAKNHQQFSITIRQLLRVSSNPWVFSETIPRTLSAKSISPCNQGSAYLAYNKVLTVPPPDQHSNIFTCRLNTAVEKRETGTLNDFCCVGSSDGYCAGAGRYVSS